MRIGLVLALLPAVALVAAWLMVSPRTPDLAAAVYRVGLYRQLGFAVWDEHWYAGHDLPGYSLLFAPLASLLGLRLLAVLSVLASATLFDRLALELHGPHAHAGAALFALAAAGDIWLGRVAFALGVPFALAAALVHVRGRAVPAVVLAVVLAALCAAASPVAGALLGLAAVTHSLTTRSARTTLVLAVPAAVVIGALALLFPEGGYEPYPLLSFAATLLVVIAFMFALPRATSQLRAGAAINELRAGAAVYALACLLFLLVKSPMGSNVERYGVLLAGPLLLCAVNSRAPRAQQARLRRLPAGVMLALCAWAVWVVWGPVRETIAVAGNESTSAAYYAPLEGFLAAHGGARMRVEVPLTRSHWEADLLAPKVSLARGWEKQLEDRYDHALLAPDLTAASYRAWLQQQAVSYVALPDTRLDPSSAQEGRLIRAGLPYLHEVFESRHWTLYAVDSPTPIVSGPGRLTLLGHDSFALSADAPGAFLVRVHFSRFLTIVRGSGCVGAGPDGWTSLSVRAPGAVVVSARFSLSRALGLAGRCRVEAHA